MSVDEHHRRYLNRMRAAGIPETTAQDIATVLRDVANRRSALRLEAAQGGWLDSDEYVDALQAVTDGQQLVRSKYGDDIFERYLYATQEPNRVVVTSVPPEEDTNSELLPGDIIHRLDDVRCFSIREYRQHVDAPDVECNEPVSLIVRRGSQLITLQLSRAQLQRLAVEPAYARL